MKHKGNDSLKLWEVKLNPRLRNVPIRITFRPSGEERNSELYNSYMSISVFTGILFAVNRLILRNISFAEMCLLAGWYNGSALVSH